jgi:hypothetical protein
MALKRGALRATGFTRKAMPAKAGVPYVQVMALVNLAPWVDDAAPHYIRAIVEGAIESIGCCEEPLGSNRGPQVDEWNRAAGVPVGSFWCASWAGAIWRAAGVSLPGFPARVEAWREWAVRNGTWRQHPEAGDAVIYGTTFRASHIGIVIRTAPAVLSIEGNTTIEGATFERNGTAVALKLVTGNDPVLGFVRPMIAKGAAA